MNQDQARRMAEEEWLEYDCVMIAGKKFVPVEDAERVCREAIAAALVKLAQQEPVKAEHRDLWQVAMQAWQETEDKNESIRDAWERVVSRVLSASPSSAPAVPTGEFDGAKVTLLADAIYGAPAVPDAAKPETQGERAEFKSALAEVTQLLKDDDVLGASLALSRVEKLIDDLLSAGPMRVEPLTEEQRKGITAMWSRENRNYTVSDIIDAVEAAHGIGKDQAS